MTELIVLLACLQGPGCPQATSAYYMSHPEIKRTVKHQEAKLKELVGPEIVAISPLFILAGKGRATIRLAEHVNLQVSSTGDKLMLFSINF
jgi:hypothetical protein